MFASFSLTQYRILTRLISPLVWLWDTHRAWRQPIYRANRSERWARQLPAPLSDSIIWVHAVSVGETQACAPLLQAILAQYPSHTVLLTHMTPTGRDTGAALFADDIAALKVQQCYLPYDIDSLAKRFLAHFKPVAGIILETEIWPNWVAAARAAGIPLGLANGRLSDKTLTKSLRFKRLSQETFNAFNWIAAQSAADASRYQQLCDKAITVTGNLKFDVTPNAEQMAAGRAFKESLKEGLKEGQNIDLKRPVIALVSTREGEEALLLPQLLPIAQAHNALILLIPRHPKRAAELIELTKTLSLRTVQRSLGETPDANTQLMLCDTLGEMWWMLGAADVVIVGGGWLPYGGQNLIEPCAVGCATVVGSHMYNFAHATELAVAAGAVVQCATANDLPEALNHLMNKPAHKDLGARALAFASAHGGATQSHMTLLGQSIKLTQAHQAP